MGKASSCCAEGPGAGSRSSIRTTRPRGRSPSISSMPSDSVPTGKSGTARWGMGGACRPTAARHGPTGSSSSSAPSGNTSRPTESSRGATPCMWAPPTASSCRGIAARPGRRSPTRPARSRHPTHGAGCAASTCWRWAGSDGSLWAGHLRGLARSTDGGRTWTEYPAPTRCPPPGAECVNRVRALAADTGSLVWVGTERGLYRLDPTHGAWLDKRGNPTCPVGPVVKGCRVDLPPVQALVRAEAGHAFAGTRDGVYAEDGDALNVCDMMRSVSALLLLAPGVYAAGRPTGLGTCRIDQRLTLVGVTYQERPDTDSRGTRHTWFERPIALTDQPYIDQTYRYGSTMGGSFQEHQGVEFNNPDGTPVHAIGDGVVVFAGPAERGANTVAIRHDRRLKGLFVFSTYYHNAQLLASVGQRVKAGDVIALVGNTGRATNDHLHLEVHAAPADSVPLIVDPNERFPKYTVNPELWIRPLPGTGIVAGRVWDAQGQPAQQVRVYGLVKAEPQETPYSYAETYGEHNHPDPDYREHFAVSDVEPGEYTLAVAMGGRRMTRRVRVEANRVTWVEFGSGAH